MRKPSICADVGVINMAATNQNQDAGESRMERMRKFLSSPLTRKKSSGTQMKVFGTPLEVLVQRTSSGADVPYIITRICEFIEKSGMNHEGIFRISGNARLIDRLKSSFDQAGDAPLESEGDVPSAAGLLKLFLRELPEPLIPSSMHQLFLNTVKVTGDKEECANQLKFLLERLPYTNFNVLKYLSYFLLRVTQHEDQNRMNASALGIVFGPNLFRVADDFRGLREQSLTNQIVTCFISDYFILFEGEGHPSIEESAYADEVFSDSISSKKATLTHKNQISITTCSVKLDPVSVSLPVKEEDTPYFQMEKTRLPKKQNHGLMVDSLIEKAINQTVTEHLFGEDKTFEKGSESLRRKRKDRKLPDELKAFRSVSEEGPTYRGEKPILSTQSCSSSHNDISCEIEENIVHPFEALPQQKDKKVSGIQLSRGDIDKVVTSTAHMITDVSPQPPKPKRREVESFDSSEPLLDPQGQRKIHLANQDLDFHEIQRNAERFAPHIPSSKSRSGSSREFLQRTRKVVEEFQKARSDVHINYHQDITSKSIDFHTQYEERKYDSDSMKENREVIHIGLHDMPAAGELSSSLCDSSEEDHLQLGYHGYYHRKHHQQDEERLSHPLLELHPACQDFQLEEIPMEETENNGHITDISTKDYLPPSSLDLVCDTEEGIDPVPSEHRFSWPVLKGLQDDDAMLSPFPHHLRKTSSYEAPLSPSAYKTYLSHRCSHLDPSLPPSPPVEQEDFLKNFKEDEVISTFYKQLTRKIHSLKKKVKHFEETFEIEHGYRPSHAEKMNYPDVKKMITELNKARKDLKHVKEETLTDTSQSSSPWFLPPSTDALVGKSSKATSTTRQTENHGAAGGDIPKPTVEESLMEALKNLNEKRWLSRRPESLEKMTGEQVIDEKLAIQKTLLKFESIHGRPSTKADKEVMRPLYDRYRSVKRILAWSTSTGATSSKGKDLAMELQPILEHVAMDFTSPEHRRMSEESQVEQDQSKIEDEITQMQTKNEEDINNHNNVHIQKQETDKDCVQEDLEQQSFNMQSNQYHHSNLHELSLSELLSQQQKARLEKHKLRRVLRDFEEQFQKQTGKKVQREDKAPMETVYGEYKHVKARLKLLEALVTKHEHHKI